MMMLVARCRRLRRVDDPYHARSGANGDRQVTQINGTGGFVGQLRGSDPVRDGL